jgi:hypothetical protein
MQLCRSAKPPAFLDVSDGSTGLNVVASVVALVTAVNGTPPPDGEIAAALADESLPNGPDDVAHVRELVALGGKAPMGIAPTEDDEDWGDSIDRLPAEIEARLGIAGRAAPATSKDGRPSTPPI